MGVVYQVGEESSGRILALKTIRPDVLSDPTVRRRFLAECDSLANLHHPNIIRIYDLGEKDGQPYFTMPFIKGGSLAKRFGEFTLALDGTKVSDNELYERSKKAAWLLATVARAVHAMHQAGIIHRDLKRSNILLEDNGEPLVADLGVAARAVPGEVW